MPALRFTNNWARVVSAFKVGHLSCLFSHLQPDAIVRLLQITSVCRKFFKIFLAIFSRNATLGRAPFPPMIARVPLRLLRFAILASSHPNAKEKRPPPTEDQALSFAETFRPIMNWRRFAGLARLGWFASILLVSRIDSDGATKSISDHLVPFEEAADAETPEAAYETLWRQKLLVTPGEIARSVHLPGTVGVETAVSVYRSPFSEGEYWVTATQTSESLWACVAPDAARPIDSNSIKVVELKARLPETTALALQKVWRAMLLGVREPPKSTEMLLEGSTEIFSAAAADGRVLIGQFQGLGQRNTAALSTLANLLLQYCDSPEAERVDIVGKIDKAASDLLSRVASTGGSKKRNSKLASSSKAARTPRNQHTSQPTAGCKPTTHVTRLGASIDDFRFRWGTPVRGIVFARTTKLVWRPAGRKNKALPVSICEAQVSFLDRIACKIVLRSKQPLTKRKSVKLAKMVVPHFRASDLTTHKSRSGGGKTYALSSGGDMTVWTYRKAAVIVTRSPLFLHNTQLFAQEAASARLSAGVRPSSARFANNDAR